MINDDVEIMPIQYGRARLPRIQKLLEYCELTTSERNQVMAVQDALNNKKNLVCTGLDYLDHFINKLEIKYRRES